MENSATNVEAVPYNFMTVLFGYLIDSVAFRRGIYDHIYSQ